MPLRLTLRILALLPFLLTDGRCQESATLGTAASGSVNGTLIAYDGKPAPGYVVDLIGSSSTSTAGMRVGTDKDGIFAFDHLKMGEYVIVPYLEDEYSRYPAGASSFYDPNPVRLQLTNAEPSKQLTIHLGPPNRILSGVVASRSDGSPVTATIQIEYPNDPDRFIRFSSASDGAFRVLIPAKVRLAMKTTAPGYAADSQMLGPVADDIDPQLSIKLGPTRP
jgi:hypothetical protein